MNENPLNSCRPKCYTSLYSIYRITLTTTPILAFGFMPLVCNSAGSPIMSPIQQVRNNTPLYTQDTHCWICSSIPITCTHHLGVVALLYRSLCDTAIKFTQGGVVRAPAHPNRTELFIEKHSPWNCVNFRRMPELLAANQGDKNSRKALQCKDFCQLNL